MISSSTPGVVDGSMRRHRCHSSYEAGRACPAAVWFSLPEWCAALVFSHTVVVVQFGRTYRVDLESYLISPCTSMASLVISSTPKPHYVLREHSPSTGGGRCCVCRKSKSIGPLIGLGLIGGKACQQGSRFHEANTESLARSDTCEG